MRATKPKATTRTKQRRVMIKIPITSPNFKLSKIFFFFFTTHYKATHKKV